MKRLLIDKGDLRVWEICDHLGVMVITDARDKNGKWHTVSMIEK